MWDSTDDCKASDLPLSIGGQAHGYASSRSIVDCISGGPLSDPARDFLFTDPKLPTQSDARRKALEGVGRELIERRT